MMTSPTTTTPQSSSSSSSSPSLPSSLPPSSTSPPSLPPTTSTTTTPTPPRPRRPTRAIPQLPPASDLTPLRAHYLKKSLIQLQFSRELDALTTPTPSPVSTLSFLGAPFSPPPASADPYLDLPLLRFVFRQFVLSFPFMAAAPRDFYPAKLQPFVDSALARNLAPTSLLDPADAPGTGPVDAELAARRKLYAKVERNLALFLGAATRIVEPEDVVRLSQADLTRLEELARRRMRRPVRERLVFEVSVVGVRTVVDKGRMRSRAHEEFIVRTRRSNYPDVFVARRYGDFRTLAHELQKAHPDEDIRAPPPKDRTVVTSAPAASPQAPAWPAEGAGTPEPGAPGDAGGPAPSRLAREKNRLTLRAYLHALRASAAVASSPVLRSFLLAGPVVLSGEELEDVRRREEADGVREEGRRRFAKEIADRVEGLRGAVRSVKGDVMGKDGLTRVFATIKVTPDVRGLPDEYKAVLEWARVSLASTVFHHFVASDNSSESFASLKRIHGLMPYFMLKTVLKVSNPIAMIRGVLDLFLAQPFGGRSLIQRMFTSSLTEEVKQLEAEIEAVKDKVDDPIMCTKIRQLVYAPREIQEMYKADAAAENMNLLTIVLRAADEPVLSRVQMHRLARAHRAHAAYLKQRATLADSDDDDGPRDEDAWLMEDLKVLTHLYSRLRDREQLIALIFEGFTAELLKDIITIFYTPLAQVYRAASIADSLNDLQNFINDLIRTVEQVEDLSQEDPHRTVQAFIALVERHEQAFYHFVHKVHSKGEHLFGALMRWIELFLTVLREGLGAPVSLEFLLPHTGAARADILAEVDAVARYHYRRKVAYEDKIRRRFGRMHGAGPGADEEAAQVLVDGVVADIDFGTLMQGGADDLAAEETDSEGGSGSGSDDDDDESGSGSESSSSGEEESSEEEESTSEEEEVVGKAGGARPPPHPHPHPHPVRSQTMRPRTPPAAVPAVHARAHSLRHSRSMTAALGQLSLGGRTRHSHDQARPPVPPLPSAVRSAGPVWDKPLPPSPVSALGPGREPGSPVQAKAKAPGKAKKPPALKPPELKHIPLLLPVFVEQMRPLLRPRQA